MFNSNSGIGIDYFKKVIGIGKFWIGIEVSYKTFNWQINLPFNFFIQKYFFHNNPTWNINEKYLLIVKSIRYKKSR